MCFCYEGVETVHEDMTVLPFADSSFDTVTLIAGRRSYPTARSVLVSLGDLREVLKQR